MESESDQSQLNHNSGLCNVTETDVASLHKVHMQHVFAFHPSSRDLLFQGWESCDPHSSIFNKGHFAGVWLSSPSQKVVFLTCTEGSRWGHSIHIHQPRSATLTLTPAPHPCSLHGLNRSNLGLVQDPQNMFIIPKAGKHEEPSHQQSPHHPNSKSALRHLHSQASPSRMEHLPL